MSDNFNFVCVNLDESENKPNNKFCSPPIKEMIGFISINNKITWAKREIFGKYEHRYHLIPSLINNLENNSYNPCPLFYLNLAQKTIIKIINYYKFGRYDKFYYFDNMRKDLENNYLRIPNKLKYVEKRFNPQLDHLWENLGNEKNANNLKLEDIIKMREEQYYNIKSPNHYYSKNIDRTVIMNSQRFEHCTGKVNEKFLSMKGLYDNNVIFKKRNEYYASLEKFLKINYFPDIYLPNHILFLIFDKIIATYHDCPYDCYEGITGTNPNYNKTCNLSKSQIIILLKLVCKTWNDSLSNEYWENILEKEKIIDRCINNRNCQNMDNIELYKKYQQSILVRNGIRT